MGRSASEEVLCLTKAKCLSVLLYGTEACQVNLTDMRSLEFTMKRVMSKIFCILAIVYLLSFFLQWNSLANVQICIETKVVEQFVALRLSYSNVVNP